ncbi:MULTISPECIES: hypothetical protein [unclassified Acinetobacter]|uniref:hypothetical protein n=1 Tax=unclassified Acinetobacter TaxID=196816 RepID=UPI0015D31D98|nr:hypothetical protein [Acinetobacter sp. YH01022]
MISDIERYFICNILHTYEEIIKLSGTINHPLYNDEKYSILNNKLAHISINLLHFFEQKQFSEILNISIRDQLNTDKESPYHRVFSYAIKSKHGTIKNKNYTDSNLKLPLCVYIFKDDLLYDYFYQPHLYSQNKEYFFLEDLYLTIIEVMKLSRIDNINIPQIHMPQKKYSIENNVLAINVLDQYKYLDYGIANTLNLKTFEFIQNRFVQIAPMYEIQLRLLAPQHTKPA